MNKEYFFPRSGTPQMIKSEKKFMQPALSSLKHKNPFAGHETGTTSPQRFYTYCSSPKEMEKVKRPAFVPKLDTSSILHNLTEQNSARLQGSEAGDSSSRVRPAGGATNRTTKSARSGLGSHGTSPIIN